MSTNSAITSIIEPPVMTDRAFGATYTGGAVALTINVKHQVIFNNQLYDIGSIYDPVTGICSIDKDGLYNFKAFATFNNPSDAWTLGQNVVIEIAELTAGPTYTNIIANSQLSDGIGATNSEYPVLATDSFRLTAGQDIVATVRTNQNNKTFIPISYFSCFRSGD